MEEMIKIRDVSLKYGVSARTLRYYEDMDLLTSIRSNDYAYRAYDMKSIRRLEQILTLRKLNISIKDIQKIFQTQNPMLLLDILGNKIGDIDEEVAVLYELKHLILEFIKQIKEYNLKNEEDIKKLYDNVSNIEAQIIQTGKEEIKEPLKKLAEVTEKAGKLPYVRIVELPASKMVSSGYDTGNGELEQFDEWWSEYDKSRKDKFFPRDFMCYDMEKQATVWYYAVDEIPEDTGGFEVVDFEGGLYAAAVSRDGDDTDGMRVYNGIKEWVSDSGCFENDERPGHYNMFHIITPPAVKEAIGYHQLEIYVPIKVVK